MTQTIKHIFTLLLAVLALVSCERGADASSDIVSLPLTITVEDMECGTVESRSDATRATTETVISDEVKNLWVVLFNGTSDSSVQLAAHYISDVTTSQTLDFIYTIRTNTVVYLANTSNAELITDDMTLGDVKALSTSEITAPTSTTQYYTEGGTIQTISGSPYYVMSGSQTLTTGLNSSSTLTASLKRSTVKVTINLQNRWDQSTITGLTLCSVAGKTGYFMNRSDFDLTAEFPTNLTSTLNFPTQSLSIEGDFFSDEEDVAWTSFTLYIPANMRGTSSDSTSEETKPTYAPTGATNVVVSVKAEDGATYNYTYYLGEDLISDYNLKPNYHYTYSLSFRSVSDPDSDDRIELVSDTE